MTTYTVQQGDSLSLIALKRYGTYNPIGSWNPVQSIAQANNISNVNLISVGQVLNIPDKPGTAVSSTPAAIQNSSTATPVATMQAKAQSQPTANTNTGSGSNTLKYVLISLIVGTGAFIGYKEYKKYMAKKKSA
jgi:LysM repeat protein